jgi:anaerobic magnesium-protoporphyrin IX monomethyl ester cyclase
VLLPKNTDGPVVIVAKEIMYTFPFGYAYLAGYLKQQGESVLVEFRPESKELFKEFGAKIIAMNPLLVGFGTIYPDLYPVRDLIQILNELGRDFPIVVGGQMVSPTPEFSVKITGADYGVIGEGELIFFDLVTSLRRSEVPYEMKGILIADGDRVVNNGAGSFIEDLSDLPPIPYDLFPEERWLSIGQFYAGYADYYLAPMYKYTDRIVPIHGGRGCPYKCNFCYHHSVPRYRPMSSMMEEADMLIERFDASMIEFSDDLVIATPHRARELVEGISGLKKPVEYSISCRFNVLKRMDDVLLKDLKKSGCRIMGLGLESGSQRILDVIHKRITVEEIETGLQRLKKAGIIPITAFMVGQYTETETDVERSCDLLRKLVRENKFFVSNFTVTTPFPGSELYELAFDKGYIRSDQDFFDRYNPSRDMCGVSLNMSDMSDKTVNEWRDKLEHVYLREKELLAGSAILILEKMRTWMSRKLDLKIRPVLCRGQSALMKLIYDVYVRLYERCQIYLDNKRLAKYAHTREEKKRK